MVVQALFGLCIVERIEACLAHEAVSDDVHGRFAQRRQAERRQVDDRTALQSVAVPVDDGERGAVHLGVDDGDAPAFDSAARRRRDGAVDEAHRPERALAHDAQEQRELLALEGARDREDHCVVAGVDLLPEVQQVSVRKVGKRAGRRVRHRERIRRQPMPELGRGKARFEASLCSGFRADDQAACIDDRVSGTARAQAIGVREAQGDVGKFDDPGHSRTCR